MPALRDPASHHHVGVGALVGAWVLQSGTGAFEAQAPTHSRLRYRTESAKGLAPLADVYLPGGPGPHPSVVLVHGGGFVVGSRRMKAMRFLATRLCQAGFAAATFDYRLLFRGGRLAEAVADVRTMLRWWYEQRGAFDLDTGRISACGLSAGATLMLLATGEEPLIPLSRLVSVFALYDLAGLRGRLPALMCRLLLRSRSREEWARSSPLAQPQCPVALTMLHGTRDELTPLSQAEAYLAERERLGLPTRLHVYEDAPHGFFNMAGTPLAQQALQALLAALTSGPSAGSRAGRPARRAAWGRRGADRPAPSWPGATGP